MCECKVEVVLVDRIRPLTILTKLWLYEDIFYVDPYKTRLLMLIQAKRGISSILINVFLMLSYNERILTKIRIQIQIQIQIWILTTVQYKNGQDTDKTSVRM